MGFPKLIYVGCHFCEVKNTSCFHVYRVFRVLSFYLFRICCSVFYHSGLSVPCSPFQICCFMFCIQPFRHSVFYHNPYQIGLYNVAKTISYNGNRIRHITLYVICFHQFSTNRPVLHDVLFQKQLCCFVKQTQAKHFLNVRSGAKIIPP